MGDIEKKDDSQAEENISAQDSTDNSTEESEDERNVRLKKENKELERKNAGLEEDAKRNLKKVIVTRKEKRSLVSDDEIDEAAKDRSPLGDPQTAEELKSIRKEIDQMKASTALKAKSSEQEAFQEIYRKHPELSPKNDPDNLKFDAVKEQLGRLAVRRGYGKDDIISDFEDAYLLANRDNIISDAKTTGARDAIADSADADIGGTSTSTSEETGEEVSLSTEEITHAHKMFSDKTPAEAEKIFLEGKKRRLGLK